MDPNQLMQMLQGAGGPPDQGGPPDAPDGDWLAAAINAVHQGMVSEQDPKQVSLLGDILNKLTTFQATSLAPAQGQASG